MSYFYQQNAHKQKQAANGLFFANKGRASYILRSKSACFLPIFYHCLPAYAITLLPLPVPNVLLSVLRSRNVLTGLGATS